MPRYKFYLLILSVLFGSCSDGIKTDDYEQHEMLIRWKSKYLGEDDGAFDPETKNHSEFLKHYTSLEKLSDTLLITTIFYENACGEAVGDIEINGDTILLKSVELGKEACTSGIFQRYTYWISNPTERNYTIIKM